MSTRGTVTVALSILLVTAGCVGVLTGSEPLVVEADPVAVTSAAQDDADYDEVNREEQPITQEVTVADQTREVQATNHLAEYSRTVSIGPIADEELARFIVLSTPAAEVLGRTFNPVGDMSNRELAEEVQGQYEGFENLEPAGERTTAALDTEATVSTFTTEAQFGPTGESVELTMHVTRFRHEDDFLVVVAVHPTQLDDEADRVDTMLQGVEHPAE